MEGKKEGLAPLSAGYSPKVEPARCEYRGGDILRGVLPLSAGYSPLEVGKDRLSKIPIWGVGHTLYLLPFYVLPK
jgi:hypothetical protein